MEGSLGQPLGADLVDGDDVGMAQGEAEPGLHLEPGHGRGIVAEPLVKHLDGNLGSRGETPPARMTRPR